MAERVTVDASVALSWVLPDDAYSLTNHLQLRAIEHPEMALLVPSTFWVEVANVLWLTVSRGRLSHRTANAALESLFEFGFTTQSPDPFDCLALAVEHGLAAYDAAYMEVALANESALWTIDHQLLRAATAAGIACEPAPPGAGG